MSSLWPCLGGNFGEMIKQESVYTKEPGIFFNDFA